MHGVVEKTFYVPGSIFDINEVMRDSEDGILLYYKNLWYKIL